MGREQTQRLRPRVGVASLSSPLEVGADRAPQAAEDLAALLSGAGCEVIPLGAVDTPDRSVAVGRRLAGEDVDAVALATVSWCEDYLALDLLEYCDKPLLLWALPGMQTGALCGTQQLTCYLKQIGAPYACVFGAVTAGDELQRAKTFLRAAALKRALRRARVGLAGHRVAGMTEVAASEFALKKAVGPRVVPLDLPQLLARAEEIADDDARAPWEGIVTGAGCCNVDSDTGLDSMKVYLAFKEQVAEHGLAALTVGCYPHLMGRVCLAASLLADEGVPLGCEGDVNGAVGQLMLTLLTGQPTHNTDWLEPLEDGSMVFTHCGSASFDLAEDRADIRLDRVRLMDRGVCALFPSRPGPVTLVSLAPLGGGYQIAVLEGEALSTEMVFPGNPLRVKFATPTPELIDWIHAEGIGHHWMAGYGYVGAEVRAWAHLAGESLRLVPAPKA